MADPIEPDCAPIDIDINIRSDCSIIDKSQRVIEMKQVGNVIYIIQRACNVGSC